MWLHELKACSNLFLMFNLLVEAMTNPMVFFPIQKGEVPPVGWYKLNMDAAMDIRNGRVDYCAVIHDSNGHVMAVGVDQCVFSDDVDIAEIEPLHFGI